MKTAETPPGRIGDVRAANRTIAHNSDDFCLQCTKFEIASWLALNHPQEGRHLGMTTVVTNALGACAGMMVVAERTLNALGASSGMMVMAKRTVLCTSMNGSNGIVSDSIHFSVNVNTGPTWHSASPVDIRRSAMAGQINHACPFNNFQTGPASCRLGARVARVGVKTTATGRRDHRS